MSWSYKGVGRPDKVAADAAAKLAAVKCTEPEETIKSKAANIIAAALAVFPPETPVQVEACGSQHTPDHNKPGEIVNSFKLAIDPIYGFVS